jgi:hypothetical protein
MPAFHSFCDLGLYLSWFGHSGPEICSIGTPWSMKQVYRVLGEGA